MATEMSHGSLEFPEELLIASYPGLPSQLFSQPCFSTVAKKAVREGLGTRLNCLPFLVVLTVSSLVDQCGHFLDMPMAIA